MSVTVFAPALWGLAGAGINAGFRLSTALCGGENEPSRNELKLAWSQFVISVLAGMALAAAFTPPLTTTTHAPVPPVAVTIGLCGNVLWPALRDNVGSKIAALIIALFGAALPLGKPPRGPS